MINTPPIPTRCIASRSAVIPARVRLPSDQNQYTHGRASSGGRVNAVSKSGSADRNTSANDTIRKPRRNALIWSGGLIDAASGRPLRSRAGRHFRVDFRVARRGSDGTKGGPIQSYPQSPVE